MNLSANHIKVLLASRSLSLALVAAAFAYQASSPQASQMISAEELVKILHSPKSEKPLLIQAGSHVLYAQAHIPGSAYVGPGASESRLRQLSKRAESLPRNKFIVIYGGCCPGPIVPT
jgi:hypothetical protein